MNKETKIAIERANRFLDAILAGDGDGACDIVYDYAETIDDLLCVEEGSTEATSGLRIAVETKDRMLTALNCLQGGNDRSAITIAFQTLCELGR